MRTAVAVLLPEDREEAFIHLSFADALVATVDIAWFILRMELRVGRNGVQPNTVKCAFSASRLAQSMPGAPVVKGAASGRNIYNHQFGLVYASGFGGL